jgi:hypothetical protein
MIQTADGKRHHTPDERAKQSAAQKGKSLTPEHRAKISASNRISHNHPDVRAKKSVAATGRTHTDQVRLKISIANKGQRSWNKGRTGIYSEEMRKRMSDGKKGKPRPDLRDRNLTNNPMNDPATRIKDRDTHRGEKCAWYIDGRTAGRSRYCNKFSPSFKRNCRASWGNICIICGQGPNGHDLPVHHVHYDRQAGCNGMALECIPLCATHHAKSNGYRPWWIAYFEQRLWNSMWGWHTDLVSGEEFAAMA